MPSKYLYMNNFFNLCCVQKSRSNGKYFILIGEKKYNGEHYNTVEEAQIVLDELAKDMGWEHV